MDISVVELVLRSQGFERKSLDYMEWTNGKGKTVRVGVFGLLLLDSEYPIFWFNHYSPARKEITEDPQKTNNLSLIHYLETGEIPK